MVQPPKEEIKTESQKENINKDDTSKSIASYNCIYIKYIFLLISFIIENILHSSSLYTVYLNY